VNWVPRDSRNPPQEERMAIMTTNESRARFFEGSLSDSVQNLWLRYYPVSRHQRFKELLLQNIRPADRVLEIGAGSGRFNQNHFDLRGKAARYVGVDPDSSVLDNFYLDEAYHCTADSLPFPDESFDIVFHYYVAEHFEEPMACHREIARVLNPGGLLLFQTPSRYWYPMLVAQVTPQWFHEFYVRHFGSGRAENEVFPTYYRFNDDQAITKQLQNCGFTCELEHHSVAPGYLRFSKLSFLAGVLYERFIEKRVPALRGVILGIGRKKASVLHDFAQRAERRTTSRSDSAASRIGQKLAFQLED
jgi:ubiquinone/menaquinone biosynthesis C-methylase UbiE